MAHCNGEIQVSNNIFLNKICANYSGKNRAVMSARFSELLWSNCDEEKILFEPVLQ